MNIMETVLGRVIAVILNISGVLTYIILLAGFPEKVDAISHLLGVGCFVILSIIALIAAADEKS